MVSVAKGRSDEKCSLGAAQAHEAQGMRRHIPLALVAKPFGENYRSPQKMCVNWRLTSKYRAEARESCSNVNSFKLTMLQDWWKGSPVLDGCESGNTVVRCPCSSRSTKEMQSGHEVF